MHGCCKVADIAIGRDLSVVGNHGFACQKILSNIRYVVAVVGVFGPIGVARLYAFGTALRRKGQGLDLHPRVVVIKLAVHMPALGRKQVANRIPQSSLAPMAHMQRTGRVGRHKLHQQALAVQRLLLAVEMPCFQNLTHHLLLGLGGEPQIEKTRPSDFDGRQPLLTRFRSQ